MSSTVGDERGASDDSQGTTQSDSQRTIDSVGDWRRLRDERPWDGLRWIFSVHRLDISKSHVNRMSRKASHHQGGCQRTTRSNATRIDRRTPPRGTLSRSRRVAGGESIGLKGMNAMATACSDPIALDAAAKPSAIRFGRNGCDPAIFLDLRQPQTDNGVHRGRSPGLPGGRISACFSIHPGNILAHWKNSNHSPVSWTRCYW